MVHLEKFIKHNINLNRPFSYNTAVINTTSFQIRKAFGDLAGMDLVPEPAIVAAALRACRRINDYSLTTRILEVVKAKCAPNEGELWPYMLQELKPTLAELGVSTPDELGYGVPELMLPNPYEIHGEDEGYSGGPPPKRWLFAKKSKVTPWNV